MSEAHELVRPAIIKAEADRSGEWKKKPPVTGIAWANVDSTCTLNYQVCCRF
jgi:hypothetical protein